ncbi:PREDICTED: E3 ubiquitin-protein ligase MIEL1-like isoform X2 [Lupinus angustifolius]|uniref:E3 ubiquitin-protein ligase MIEL1-like isoform X2 n=1 Tax=Lupinus angustifolius TaxID=3871 RepID=UPI00092F9A52|nr:PREDICTED: E3 ubiquitin-protein ligase MIEL1-like isoform X2 [Lupinus angustifolius]
METKPDHVSSPFIPLSSHLSSSILSSMEELGINNFGCMHYRRRCKIRAPCCDEVFDCRHCHNEVKNSMETNPVDRHEIPRHEVKKVQQYCINCGVCLGKYFCGTCKFFDDDISKEQYHCEECGICRTGGRDNFFHCEKCGCCYSKIMEKGHPCVERAMHHNCPICFEYLFETLRDITVLPCGHTIHVECVREMEQHQRYSCPVCSKSMCDMTNLWKKFDEVIASTPMPKMYKDKMVWILCNDCGENSHVQFHIVGHKCKSCKSYNTRRIQGNPGTSCSSRMSEMIR